MITLEHELKHWPAERVMGVLQARRLQAISGAGDICTPCAGAYPSYYPFDAGGYAYKASANALLAMTQSNVLPVDLRELVPVDPFAPSEIRPGGLRVWDAAACIPAAAIRPQKIMATRTLTPVRNVNTLWASSMVPALNRVGPLGPNGEILRPTGPYIFDLMRDPLGWRMLEGAHALAHRVAETKPRQRKKTIAYAGRTLFHVPRFLAQLCVCRAYGLPIDVLCLDEGIKAEPDVVQYGIEIKSSGHFRSPVLRVATMTNETPRPDETIAFVCVSVYIEPHPHGYTTGSGDWLEINRWSCQPTILAIVGWELIDVVSHQPLCASDPADSREPKCYGMCPSDMQSPETFWAYLAKAVEHRGLPKADNRRYWMVEDWLSGADYEAAVGEAPPLPCLDCMRVNMRAEGAPMRPRRPPPAERPPREKRLLKLGKMRYTDAELEWMAWKSQLDEIKRIAERAVIFHEGRMYGLTEAMRRRRERRRRYSRRVAELNRIRKLDALIEKANKAGQPSVAARLGRERKTSIDTGTRNEAVDKCV